jgi:phosphoribosylformylglycinamidine (FGAM) synthase PurS component
MKVAVQGGSQAVIDKLKKLGHDDLEIVTEGADLDLTVEEQDLLMQATGEEEVNKVLMNLIINKHSDKFFNFDSVPQNPMKLNLKKLKKRRAKNKMARKSRQVNYAKAKSKRKSHA